VTRKISATGWKIIPLIDYPTAAKRYAWQRVDSRQFSAISAAFSASVGVDPVWPLPRSSAPEN